MRKEKEEREEGRGIRRGRERKQEEEEREREGSQESGSDLLQRVAESPSLAPPLRNALQRDGRRQNKIAL